MEALVAQVNSLQHKLGGNNDSKEFTSFLIQLMRGKEVSVPGGSRSDIGTRIITMFYDAQKVAILLLYHMIKKIHGLNVKYFDFASLQAANMMTSVSNSNDATDVTGENSRQKMFPEPSCKEFILRAIIPRPSPASTPQPQRLYACLKRDDICLAGFFSEDTTFL